MAIREYFVLWAIGILCVFSLAIGVEKMMKIMFGNYLLSILCLALWPTLDVIMWWSSVQMPDVQKSLHFLFTNKTITILVIYLLMLILIFVKSRLHVWFYLGGAQKIFVTILCIPMTIISILLTLEIAILGVQAFDVLALQSLASTMPISQIYKDFIINTPIIVAVHTFVTILMLSDLSALFKKKWGGGIHIED